MKILIIRFSSLGDITMATVLPRHLKKKFPDAKVDMAVREDYRELIEWNPYLDDKLYVSRHEGFGGLWRLMREIRKRRYDIIVDAHRSIRSRFICLCNPSVEKFYFDKRTFKRLILIFLKFNLFRKVDLQMIEYLKPLSKLGINYDRKGTEIFIPDNIEDKVGSILRSSIPDMDTKPLIGIVPSAHWPGKRWPTSNFVELAGMMTSKIDSNVVVVGGGKDSFCDEIASVDKKAHSFAGKFSMIESAAALSFCDLVIANDTGMMHVAEAVGTDVVGIMGPTSYEFGCYPYRGGSRVVELDMWCRPCSKNGKGPCIRGGKRPCLNNITPDMVFEEVVDYFKARES